MFKVLTNGTTTFEDVATLFPVGGGRQTVCIQIDEGYKWVSSTKPLTTKCYTVKDAIKVTFRPYKTGKKRIV